MDLLIEFTGMSTRLELFNMQGLGNRVLSSFIFTFFVLLFFRSFFLHAIVSNINVFFLALDRTLTGTTTLHWSVP